MKFTAKMGDHQIGGHCVNPGEWFGKAWVVEVGIGCSSLFYAVEGDHEQAVIDALTDSEEYGHVIRYDSETEALDAANGEEENICRAGNASEPVDLDNVAIHGCAVSRMNDDIPYNAKEGCSAIRYDTGETPIEYANRE